MSIFFKDLAKKAKDLLDNKKHYTTGGNKKFSIKTKTANGTTYSAESTVDGSKAKGKVKCEFKMDCGLTVKSLSLDNSGCFASDLTLDKVLNNVRFTHSNSCGLVNGGANMEGEVGVEYDNQDFKAKVGLISDSSANASVCFRKDNFFAGGAFGVQFDEFEFNTYDFGLGYSEDQTTTALNCCNQLSTFKLSHYRQQCADLAMAGNLVLNLANKDSDNMTFAIEFGGSYKVDCDTTVYGKLTAPSFSSKDLTGSFSMDQKLNDNASLSLTTVVDLNPRCQSFFDSQFGLALKLGA